MLPAADALQRILALCRPLPPQRLPLLSALGRVLAENAASDLDMPPFDKSLMDGYAVRSADGTSPRQVVEEIFAGHLPTRPIAPGQAARVMTGAALPEGADAVVPHELVRLMGDLLFLEHPPRPESYLLRKATEYRQGQTLLSAGTLLRPQEIGVLAAIGRVSLAVIPAPRVGILATGDELVEPPVPPGPGQLRNSNAPMLAALVQRAAALPSPLGIARDSEESLTPLIRQGLAESDVMLLAGGVSAGNRDLVPGVLTSLGVRAHFHHVNLKPGKPLLFGTTDAGQLVFGLPGNPVSAFVTFELFVRPALNALGGKGPLALPSHSATLSAPLLHHSDRPTYHPAHLSRSDQRYTVRTVPWRASADLVSLLAANALIVLPAGDLSLSAGSMVETLALDA